MKNYILSFLFLFVYSSVFAQGNFSLYQDNGNNLETNFYKKLSSNLKNNRGDYTGSPFLEEKLELGALILNGGDAQVFFMRYNVLEQRIEFSETNDVETLKMLPKEDNIVIQLNGKTYQYLNVGDLPTGYYEIVKIMLKKGATNLNQCLEIACTLDDGILNDILLEKGATFCTVCNTNHNISVDH